MKKRAANWIHALQPCEALFLVPTARSPFYAFIWSSWTEASPAVMTLVWIHAAPFVFIPVIPLA